MIKELFQICYFIYFLIHQRRRRLSICISLKGDADWENRSMTLTKETRVAKPHLLFEGGALEARVAKITASPLTHVSYQKNPMTFH
jgi:hypothetical protein